MAAKPPLFPLKTKIRHFEHSEKTKFKQTRCVKISERRANSPLNMPIKYFFFATFAPHIAKMDFNQVIKKTFQGELQLFEKYLHEAVANEDPRISKAVNHILKTRGKYLRPILVFLSAKVCGDITPKTYFGAVAVELLHTASLVHDDVIDESAMRRGRPSVNAIFCNTYAVLIGDYLLSIAALEGVKMEDLEIINMIVGLSKSLAEGEINQFVVANEMIIDEEEYFNVIDKKTASLMRACTIIGAKTAGADKDIVDQFSLLGQSLGIAFQIKDDIFDYFSDDIGKPIGNDIREGKVTLPLIYALQNAPKHEAKQIFELIEARDFTIENVKKILDFAKNNGGIEYAYRKIDEQIALAENITKATIADEEKRELMRQLLRYLRDRRY